MKKIDKLCKRQTKCCLVTCVSRRERKCQCYCTGSSKTSPEMPYIFLVKHMKRIQIIIIFQTQVEKVNIWSTEVCQGITMG